MAIKFTYSDESGFETIPGDPLSQMVDPIEGTGGVPSNYIKSVYEYTYFSTTITMQGKYTDPMSGEFTYLNAINHTTNYDWASHGLTYTKINNYTMKLEGPVTNVFADQYYEFSMPDYTSQILPFNHETPFWSLNKYQKPNPIMIEFLYPLTVTIPPDPMGGIGPDGLPIVPTPPGLGSNTVEQVDLHQWVIWRYQTAINNIAYLRTKGLK